MYTLCVMCYCLLLVVAKSREHEHMHLVALSTWCSSEYRHMRGPLLLSLCPQLYSTLRSSSSYQHTCISTIHHTTTSSQCCVHVMVCLLCSLYTYYQQYTWTYRGQGYYQMVVHTLVLSTSRSTSMSIHYVEGGAAPLFTSCIPSVVRSKHILLLVESLYYQQ